MVDAVGFLAQGSSLVALLALAGALLWTRFDSRRHRAFATYLVLVAARILAYMLRHVNPEASQAAMQAFAFMLPGAIAWFAVVVMWPRRSRWQAVLLASLVGGTAWAVLTRTQWPVAAQWIMNDAHLALGAVVGLAFALASMRQTGTHAASLAVLSVAMLPYAAFYAGTRILAGPDASTSWTLVASAWLPWAAAAASTGALAVLVRWPPQMVRNGRLFAVSLVGMAFASAWWSQSVLPPDMLFWLGFWRLVSVALVGYGLMRHHLFGTEVRVRRSVARSALASFMLTVIFGVTEAAITAISDATGSDTLGVVGASAVFLFLVPLERWADRVTRGFSQDRPLDALDRDEKAALYRDQVVLVWADGTMGQKERGMLDQLQERLCLTLGEAARIEQEVLRAARLTPAAAMG